MSKRSFFWVFIVLSLIIPSISLSQTEEIKEYKVRTGDTLWDISRNELGDPFLWPKIWQANPDIANPDRLYPGQEVKIPLRYLQQEKEEKQAGVETAPAEAPLKAEVAVKEAAEQQAPESVPLKPLINKNLLVSSGYIADSIKGAGQIAGAPTGRIMFGNNDIVYVKTDGPVKVGDRFYIVRAGELVKHPVTHKKIGYVVEMLGVAEIIRFEYGDTLAKITLMSSDIRSGDLLAPYYEIVPPLTSGVFRRPDISGYIVASRFGHIADAKFNIAYIDKGLRDGVDVGDIVRVLTVVEGHKVPAGTIQIIDCKDTTSTAVVLDNSYGPIAVGDMITRLE